jgi:catechol 2,3-dioxygenase-like lactoylglutathione lyase family enzyme
VDAKVKAKFDVGGVLLAQPFKIRRLGHFGLNVENPAQCLDFYCELLGFRISDPLDIAEHHPKRDELRKLGDTNMYFLRHGTDHHSFVLCNGTVYTAAGRGVGVPPEVTVNQMTWQVASLAEVTNAIDWFKSRKVVVNRTGRDMPGSNWHVYPYDPEGHRNELYYGMEQIGWLGASKPKAMHERGFRERPPLPQMPEYEEVERTRSTGVDLASGFRHPEKSPAKYDVDGILLPRPFKVVRHGPIRLFCRDVRAMESFYTETMGFVRSEEVTWKGHRCVFLRCNTEHHALALYPIAVRDALGWPATTTVMSFGVQVATYRQLRNAISFLKERGCRFVDVPAELTPGIDYCAHVLDPAGHPIQLYYSMEQVGWDGVARGKRTRVPSRLDDWPETVEPLSDTYMGEPYLGPWG